jgi:hypothetical protein
MRLDKTGDSIGRLQLLETHDVAHSKKLASLTEAVEKLQMEHDTYTNVRLCEVESHSKSTAGMILFPSGAESSPSFSVPGSGPPCTFVICKLAISVRLWMVGDVDCLRDEIRGGIDSVRLRSGICICVRPFRSVVRRGFRTCVLVLLTAKRPLPRLWS